MGYNVLSGNVLLPGQLLADGQVSSSAFVGDGKELEHVLKVTSGPDRYNLTTIGTDTYKLTGEDNLTFNGTTLTVTGDVSASINISASAFYGDGSKLTGISGGGGGTGGGIFTQLSNINAYTTSSLTIGAITAPDHKIAVSGAISASLNVSASGFIGTFLNISGGVVHHHKTLSTTMTASRDDYYIGMNSNGGPVELRLPDASTLTDGHTYIVKDEYGAASSIKTITILASGSQTIDGENSLVLESAYASLSLYCNGVSKYYVY